MPQYMFGLLQTGSVNKLPGTLVDKISKQLFSEDRSKLNKNMRVTHTYLGQMLSHELVSPTNGSGRKAKAKLDLDSFYGHEDDERLYFDEYGYFHTDKDSAGNPDGDLLRVPNAVAAIIPEPRNDENLLISQLHLFWQRVHNKVAAEVRKSNTKFNKSQVISETRKYVVYLFHRVIVEDFLKLLLRNEVYLEYFENKQNTFKQQNLHFLKNWTDDLVPLEFSMACFRLGHSMVRPFYELQAGRGAKKLRDLLRHVKDSKIDQCEVVDWAHLATLKAKRIDHFLTDAMQDIPPPPGMQVCMSHTQIVEANLTAGFNAQLPYPEDLIVQLEQSHPALTKSIKLTSENSRKVHKKLEGFSIDDFPDNKLPMWLYILIEAKRFGGKGKHLGPLGSLVVAETLSYSILQVQQNWFTVSGEDFPLLPSELTSNTSLTFNHVNLWLEAK